MPNVTPPVPSPDPSEVDDALRAAGAPQGAADAHGMLCALLCDEPSLDVVAWLERLGAGAAPDREPLAALHARTRAQLAGDAFDLEPWLPDDAEPLEQRVEALGEWCQGFLGGLGLAGIDPDRLEGDVAEFVRDLAAIAQATLERDANAERAERDFVELVEFLRIGTYLVRDALRTVQRPGTSS